MDRASLSGKGLTATLRLELRSCLAPNHSLEEAISVGVTTTQALTIPRGSSSCGGFGTLLATDHVHSACAIWLTNTGCRAPPLLLDDFQQLLRDALICCASWAKPTTGSDRRIGIRHPSAPHWQKPSFRDWVSLIRIAEAMHGWRFAPMTVRDTHRAELVRVTFILHLQTSGSVCVGQSGWLHPTGAG